jgi:predicted amino acid dehydrogenase
MADMEERIEKRKSPRIPINIPIRLEMHNPPQNIPSVVEAESFDISREGIGVNIKNVILPPGISGTINLDLQDQSLKIECKVVWSGVSKTGESRCGMYFAKIENGHLSILNRINTENNKTKRKLAFITNLRIAGDWHRVLYTSKYLPKGKDLTVLKNDPGYIIWSHFDVYHKIEGYIIVVLIIGKEILVMNPKDVRKKIMDAALYAQDKLGVEYIGLGSYVPSVTKQGLWLEKQPEIKAYLTHGDHLTSWIALEGIREKTGLRIEESTIAVVGAAGLLGHPISRTLAKEAKKLILVGRNPNKLKRLKELINYENGCLRSEIIDTTDITVVKEADLVVSVTSSPDTVIEEEYLKRNVVVYDLAQPMDVTPEVCVKRPDIVKIDGGFTTIPGIELGADLGTPKGSAFSCLGDSILQCLEHTKQNSVGQVDPVFMGKIGEFARKYGFKHIEPCCFSWTIPRTFMPQINKNKVEDLVSVDR